MSNANPLSRSQSQGTANKQEFVEWQRKGSGLKKYAEAQGLGQILWRASQGSNYTAFVELGPFSWQCHVFFK